MPEVYLIEDSALLRENTRTLLEVNGFEVAAFAEGRSALEALERHTPDLVLCDIILPGIDGYEILRRVRGRESLAFLPFIFLSALAERDQVREGMNLGADDYVTKPFTADGLISTIRTRLARASSLRGMDREAMEHDKRRLQSLPHEIRTPLNGIIAGISLINEGTTVVDHETREILALIEQSANRLESTLLRYLLYLELRSGNPNGPQLSQSVSPDPSALAAETALKMAEKAGRAQDLRVQSPGPQDDPALAQPEMPGALEQILKEVYSNAFKFSEPGTPVEVGITRGADGLAITCRDHGPGMTDEEVASIGPFHQFQRQLADHRGLGLGLAISQALADFNNWRLEIRRPESGGLCVGVFLPCSQPGGTMASSRP